MTAVAKTPVAARPAASSVKIRTQSEEAWRRFRRHTTAMIGLVVLVFLIAAVMLGPLIYTASPLKSNFAVANAPMFGKFIFGTDDLGRDMLARIFFGGRISIAVTYKGEIKR